VTILNRRNALIGYLVLKAGKRATRPRPKAKPRSTRRRRVARAAGAGAATLGGLVLLRRRTRGGGDDLE